MTQSNNQGDRGNIVAVDEVTARWHADAEEDERQYGLFAEPQTEAGRQKAMTYHRGPGRPPGSRNKRTEKTVAFLLSRHRDPREVLLEIAEANVHDLAALYGCSPFEAAQEKRLATLAALPYVAQRRPLEVDVTKRSIVYLTINDGYREVIEQPGDADPGGIVVAVEPGGFTVINHEAEQRSVESAGNPGLLSDDDLSSHK